MSIQTPPIKTPAILTLPLVISDFSQDMEVSWFPRSLMPADQPIRGVGFLTVLHLGSAHVPFSLSSPAGKGALGESSEVGSVYGYVLGKDASRMRLNSLLIYLLRTVSLQESGCSNENRHQDYSTPLSQDRPQTLPLSTKSPLSAPNVILPPATRDTSAPLPIPHRRHSSTVAPFVILHQTG